MKETLNYLIGWIRQNLFESSFLSYKCKIAFFIHYLTSLRSVRSFISKSNFELSLNTELPYAALHFSFTRSLPHSASLGSLSHSASLHSLIHSVPLRSLITRSFQRAILPIHHFAIWNSTWTNTPASVFQSAAVIL